MRGLVFYGQSFFQASSRPFSHNRLSLKHPLISDIIGCSTLSSCRKIARRDGATSSSDAQCPQEAKRLVFKIHCVRKSKNDSLEPLGTKRKFWFTDDRGKHILFKADDRRTGDDWAEKVSCELCDLLGLPHIQYELAVESEDNVPGVICENCAEPPTELVLGNVLLLARDPKYPFDQARKYKVRQHTVGAVRNIVKKLEVPPARWSNRLPSETGNALDVFVGYIMLDAWIANQDRHHENWGALLTGKSLYLAPTFDHAAAMARNLTDEDRRARLASRDRGYQIEAFVRRAASAFYSTPSMKKPMTTFEAWHAFSSWSHAAEVWVDRLSTITSEDITGIFEQVPAERMSDVCRQFTIRLLLENQRRICAGEKQ